ncbi:DUF349 domain-containing protein [Pseudomarimonas arenosa]|uniref:DUF349 domain-containing protein n=1 Tax=Pseudomarimonas arenosa TaxID=2774145 RepID=A0AAW3ZI39_9GAMM|nr:DUF349 domain-containing protein [Pseudomarimonas arenosa]MBD8525750.1 DUF349 domain-containing protein [Pseudomarimonas arenosa]
MKLFGFRRKPEWQHADAKRRLTAVESLQDPALKAALPELAQTDPDPTVRIAAISRIDDLAVLERRMRGEHDSAVAEAAKQRLIQRLCVPQVEESAALEALRQVHDEEVLSDVAQNAALGGLRRLALERSQRGNLKLQRCIHDPDPELRLWLLEQIDQADALQRIADAVRKKDKRLARAARDKLDALRIAAGDPTALETRAQAIAEAAGRLTRELPDDRDPQLAALQQEWQQLSRQVSAATQRRVQGALDTAELALRAARGDWSPPPRAEPTPAPAAPEPSSDKPVQALQDQLPNIEQSDFDQSLQALSAQLEALSAERGSADARIEALRRLLEQRRRQRNDWLKAQRQAAREAERESREQAAASTLNQVEQALRQGQAQAAQEAWQSIAKPGELSAALRRRWQTCQQQLAELAQAQRWASRQARQRLCEETAALQGSGLHPDAVASRVKELQAEWSKLDQIDGDQAPPSDAGISRRFRALCHQALSPAKAYFEKRRELRGERTQAIEQLLTESLSEAADSAALLQRQQALRDGLNQLRDAAPEKRNELAAQIRAQLDGIAARLKDQREQALLGKRKLLAKLKRDLGAADAEAGIRLAKAAQAEWKQLARGRRQDEDALWQELRELIDPLFDGLRQRQDADQAQRQQIQQAADGLLAELEALATAEPERLLHADSHVESLRQRWRELGRPEVNDGSETARGKRPAPSADLDERRFDRACEAVRRAQARQQQQRQLDQLEAICRAGDWLAERRPAAALREALASLDLPASARSRFEALAETAADSSNDAQTESQAPAELLAVRAELAAGLDSPPDDQALRRQEQMQRLARKLEGAAPLAASEEILDCLIELQCRPHLEASLRQGLNQRVRAAFAAAQAG